jgi:cardiolipin synthase
VRWIPNVLSLFRLICAPIAAWLVLSGQESLALLCVVCAFFTDLLDGWMARRYHWETPIGRVLDPLADKALSFCLFGAFCLRGDLSILLCSLVLIRDMCIGLGVWWMWYKRGVRYFVPAMISKVNTGIQALLCVSILWARIPHAVVALTMVLWATTLFSFIIYGYRMWRTWR